MTFTEISGRLRQDAAGSDESVRFSEPFLL
jgi:hypothetical protein